MLRPRLRNAKVALSGRKAMRRPRLAALRQCEDIAKRAERNAKAALSGRNTIPQATLSARKLQP